MTLRALAAASSLALVATAAASNPPAADPVRSRSQVIKDVLPSNVRVAVSRGTRALRSATGVVVGVVRVDGSPVAQVLTNAHVAAGGEEDTRLEVLVDDKGKTTRHAARLVAAGSVPDSDLALLEVSGLDLPPATLAGDEEMELGDEVVVIGAPFGKGLSISSGIVSQLEWTETAKGVWGFKTDAPIGYGASGGGVYRVPDGKLLALVEGYRTAKVSFPVEKRSFSFDVPMPGETFAAPVAKIRKFLADHGRAHVLGGSPAVETAAR